MKSYKTTAMGILAILGALVALGNAILGGTLNTEIISVAVAAIMSGIGNIFAKDSNVTGGTKVQ